MFEIKEALPDYKANMTAGKYLIFPQKENESENQRNQEESKE
jgi:hypothetical protein